MHPQGKQGVNITKQQYDLMRQTMLDLLHTRGEFTSAGLTEEARHRP